jgi:hypothetical protein
VTAVGVPEKRWGRVSEASVYSGLGRSSLYKLAAKNRGLFRKHGAATIVDFNILDQILEAAPPAEFPEPAA